MNPDAALRAQLVRFLDWGDAHAGLDAVVKGIPPRLRGRIPPGLTHSAWQLLEHLRLTQADILNFCVNPRYEELHWPEDYWPDSATPRGQAWSRSLAAFRKDRRALQALARRRSIDLFARIPHGTGQTYLRELLLVADHNAHHVGQLIAVRQALGIWPR